MWRSFVKTFIRSFFQNIEEIEPTEILAWERKGTEEAAYPKEGTITLNHPRSCD